MQDHELYRRILGIEAPWQVQRVDLKLLRLILKGIENPEGDEAEAEEEARRPQARRQLSQLAVPARTTGARKECDRGNSGREESRATAARIV